MIVIKDEMKFKRVIDTIRDSIGVTEGRVREQTLEMDIKEDEIIFKNLNTSNTVFQSFKIPISTQTTILDKFYINSKMLINAIKFIRQGDRVQIAFLSDFIMMYINESEYPILYNKKINLTPPRLEYIKSFEIKYYDFQKIMKNLIMKRNQKLKLNINGEKDKITIEKIQENNESTLIYINELKNLNYQNINNKKENISLTFNVDNFKKATNLITFAGNNNLNIKISNSGPISIYLKNGKYEYICLVSPIVETEKCLNEIYV